jgi:HEAT repeat protein
VRGWIACLWLVMAPAAAFAFQAATDADRVCARQLEQLTSPDHQTRARAAGYLGMHCSSDTAHGILPLLHHDQAGTRSMAAFALGLRAENSPLVVRSLEALLSDPDEVVRIDAALAIAQIDRAAGGSPRMLPQLIAGLRNPLRADVIASFLQRLGPAAAPAVPALVDALASADKEVRFSAAPALACIGKAAAPAIPRLAEVQAADVDPGVRAKAQEAIGAIQAALEGKANDPRAAWWCR